MIIGLNGFAGCGKTHAAAHLAEKHGFIRMCFASPLKKMCEELFDLSEEQLYGGLKETIDKRYGVSPRKIFQVVGTELFRNELSNHIDIPGGVWVMKMKRTLEICLTRNPRINIVIDDVRFHDEADLIKSVGGSIIHIDMLGQVSSSTHESETKKIKCDETIVNDNTEQYCKMLDSIIEKLQSKVHKQE